LTPLGIQLLPQIDKILGSVDSLIGEARSATGRPGEPLRMGVSPLIHPSLVARAFEASRQGGLTLTEQNLTGLRQALERKELDVILVPAVAAAPGCQSRDIDAEPMRYLESGAGASTGGDQPIEIDELAAERQLLVAGECGLTTFVQALFDENGATLQRYPGGAHSYRNLVDWARLGLGGAILPESRLDEAVGAARPLVKAGKPLEIRYEALWLAQSANAPLVEGLLDAMLDNSEPAELGQEPG
jgi:DNA-binding transcriptional LysR family regulator